MSLIDEVHEVTGTKWDDVYMMNVYEFFNYISYSRYKNEKQKRALEQWRMKH